MRVVVVGGGVAGLAAATRLAERGHAVTLYERRAQLGGRAYSVVDETTGDTIDNGQHLMMGCYTALRGFLRRLGTEHLLRLHDDLDVTFVDGAARTRLRALKLPAPFHVAGGLLAFAALGWRDRLALVRHGPSLVKPSAAHPAATDWQTVDQWLDRLGQSPRARRAFWYPLVTATLNDDPGAASAKMLEAVLREGFFGAREGSRLGLARVGLSELYCCAAQKFLEARGARVVTAATVEQIVVERGAARGVRVAGARVDADAVIAAVPPPELWPLVPDGARTGEPYFENLRRLEPSPILSIHLWLDRLLDAEEMIGLIDRPVHWIFNRNRIAAVAAPARSHLTLVVSAARALVARPAQELIELGLDEVRRAIPAAARATLVHARVIKERAATIGHAAGSEALRPRARSPVERLAIAGDFVRTGLPATLESAARSADEACAIVESLAGAAPPEPPRAPLIPVERLRRA